MPYCTLDDIKTRRIPEEQLIQLTDDADLGMVSLVAVDAAIAEADELIDGHLRDRYTLPLSPVPGLLVSLAADIAAYRLYGRRALGELPKAIDRAYDNALKVLLRIQRGEISLGVTAPTQAEAPGTLQISSGGKQFGADTLERY